MFNSSPSKKNCVMYPQPYCPCCKYGFVEPKDYYKHGLVEWHCTYNKFIQEFNKRNTLR